ncbi:MAG: sulfatase [Balneolaceae bacterium]
MKLYLTGLSLVIIISALYLSKVPDDKKEENPPNIVFLFTDDHSVPDLGAYGNDKIHTPNIDRLAEEGVLFNRAYVTSSQCSPSRASILTGRYAHEVGASRLHVDRMTDFESIISMLNDKGYYTGSLRKVHQKNIESEFDFSVGRRSTVFVDAFLDELPEDTPFFIWFGTTDPHRPYTNDYEYKHDPNEIYVPDFLPDTGPVREDIANYYNEITRFDTESGEIMKLLEERGLADNTMIIMAGDNGMPFPRAKATLYEDGIQVPLIIKWPGQGQSGVVNDDLISLIDLTPTWLELAGIEVPEEMRGQSLLPLLRSEDYEKREYIFAGRNWHDNWDPMRSVVGERYKLIQNYRPEVGITHTLDRLFSPTWDEFDRLKEEGDLGDERLEYFFAESRPVVEFYDLENDPGEWNNLADDPEYADLIDEYQQALSDWMNETHDFLPSPKEAFPSKRLNNSYDVLDAEEFDSSN